MTIKLRAHQFYSIHNWPSVLQYTQFRYAQGIMISACNGIKIQRIHSQQQTMAFTHMICQTKIQNIPGFIFLIKYSFASQCYISFSHICYRYNIIYFSRCLPLSKTVNFMHFMNFISESTLRIVNSNADREKEII